MRTSHSLSFAILLFVGMLLGLAALFRPNLSTEVAARSAGEVAQAQSRRAVALSPEDPPRVQVPVSETPVGDVEPDLLQPLVENGVLPPLRERIGPEPVVLSGPESPGRYGGTLREISTNSSSLNKIQYYYSGGGLVRWSPQGYPLVPHLAKDWDVNEDQTEFTFRLRKGIRWSDGHPFTAADIVYWWNHEQNLPGFTTTFSEVMLVGAEVGDVEQIDSHTVRFTFPLPHSLFLERLASWPGQAMVNAPAHYLSLYHPVLGDPAARERLKQSFRLDSDLGLYLRIKEWNNPDHPRMWPWVMRTHQSTPPLGFVRNPYYPAVDLNGAQLPYIDRLMVDQKNQQMVPVAAAQGEVDFSWIDFGSYTVLWNGQESGDYRVLHWYSGARAPFLLFANMNRRFEPGDAAGRWKSLYLKERKFRQALSLAINRKRLIELQYAGVTEPAQVAPGPESPAYFVPELFHNLVDYDPERASALLDEIGLVQRDGDGMRTFPDGTRLHFFITTGASALSDFIGLILDDFAAIGLRVTVLVREPHLAQTELAGMRFDLAVTASNNEYLPHLEPRFHVPINSNFAREWAKWYQAGGFYGKALAAESAFRAPPQDHPLYRSMELYEALKTSPDAATRDELTREILRNAVDQAWTIAVSTTPPILMAVTNDLRNVPEVAVMTWDFLTPGNAFPETFFFRSRTDSPGAIAQLRRELTTVTSWPQIRGIVEAEGVGVDVLTWLKRVGVFVVVGAGLWLAFLYPFVARRLMILVPTLAVISVITFVVIEAPPGDFVTAKTVELEASGRGVDLQEIERLRTLFKMDEPGWVRYLHWSGVLWFFSFDAEDAGLLQGNLGRSMATGTSVNQLVGDRLLLTVLISLGTIILTWVLAVPIGIYSAVRQYTLIDYVISVLGFVGMSIPGFLLALLLMYASSQLFGINVSGLFSPEYATRPEWTWGKFIDLLQHIWLPIVVTGLAGTAGMIRVMRANLLDELGKAYVQTARAKGLRPVRLLVKYPVRIALNPFISGIGGLFPQLVSGGAIVALVLSLPTIGPLLLEALLNQDTYMAASLLMVLSFLSVLGTLLSDILLLWLDPRIRMEGGSRG